MLMKFFLKKMIKSKAPGVSDQQIDQIIAVVEKNPKLFEKIANEIKEKTKAGMNEQTAAMQVMMSYKDELAKIQGDIK